MKYQKAKERFNLEYIIEREGSRKCFFSRNSKDVLPESSVGDITILLKNRNA
jgi:hypothetical protein